MKLTTNIAVTAMALSLIAGVALATATTTTPEPPITNGQGYGMMDGQGMRNGMGPGQRNGMGMMNGQGLGFGNGHPMFSGQGRHHRGQMFGKGMRGNNGQNCFQNNRGSGMGQQQGMMQGRRGMNRGGAMMNPELVEKRDQFLDSTADLRKQLHDKRFAYREATRNPAITQGELQAQEKEIYTLRQELQTKRLAAFNAK